MTGENKMNWMDEWILSSTFKSTGCWHLLLSNLKRIYSSDCVELDVF